MKLFLPLLIALMFCCAPVLTLAQTGAPELILSHEPVCSGDTALLHVRIADIIPQNCGPASSAVNDSIRTVTIGTGTTNNTSTLYPAPYGNWYKNARHRLLYRASDLLAAGFQGGKILSVGFQVTALNGSTQTYRDYRLAMKCTPDSVAPSNFNDTIGWTEVFSPKNVFVNVGVNTHTLDVPFHWDGVSNLYLEICFNNLSDPSYTYNCSSPYTTKSYQAVVYDRNDVTPLCGSIPAFPQNLNDLPNVILTFGGGDIDLSRYSFTYNPSAQVLNQNSVDPLFLPGASSSVTVTLTDNLNGLSATQTLNINYSTTPLPISFASADTLFCPGESAVNIPVSPMGGVWSGSSAITSSGTFDPSLAGTGSFQVIYTLAAGTICQNSSTLNLEVGPPQNPAIGTTSPLTLCTTDAPFSISVVSSGGNWSSTQIDANNVLTPSLLPDGVYDFIYSFSNYCYVADTITININQGPDFQIDNTPDFCSGMSPFNMTYSNFGLGLQNVYWSGDIITDTIIGTVNPALGTIGPNMVLLTGIAFNGCKLTDTAYVNMFQPQLLITATDSTIDAGQSTTIIVFGASSWSWSNGQTTPSITVSPSATSTYVCIATLPNGCTDTVSMTINVTDNTGIDEQGFSNFTLSLNPSVTHEQASLSLLGGLAGNYQVFVTGISGTLIEQAYVSKASPLLLGGSYAPGLYFIRVIAPDGGSRMTRFLKQ